jgi:hypothetical protein
MSDIKHSLPSDDELPQKIGESVAKLLIPFLRSEISSIVQANLKKENDFLSRQQTADFLHCDKVSLWNYEKRGWIKPIRMGRKVFYSKTQLIEFMSNQK